MWVKEQPSELYFNNIMADVTNTPRLKHILLIDDDEVTNFIHESTLNEIGASEKISIAENGKQALDILKQADILPELILLDINMPIMNGIDFLENFESNVPASYRPKIIIMLTTQLTNEDMERLKSLEHLIAGNMEKPVNNNSVLSLLKKYF
jgi:CheY-like chemotaxis protein